MKRILCALLAGMMLLSAMALGGCEQEPEQTPDEQPTDTPDPEPEPDAPPVDDGPTQQELEAIKLKQDIENYNYMIGTQAFNPGYQFTELSP